MELPSLETDSLPSLSTSQEIQIRALLFRFCPPLFLFLSPCLCFSLRLPSATSALARPSISNKDEGVALIDVVANESFNSASLTSPRFQVNASRCTSPLPAGFGPARPARCRLAAPRLCCCQPVNAECFFFFASAPVRSSPGHRALMCVGISPLEENSAEGAEYLKREASTPLSLLWVRRKFDLKMNLVPHTHTIRICFCNCCYNTLCSSSVLLFLFVLIFHS